jgi:hypothetical protein
MGASQPPNTTNWSLIIVAECLEHKKKLSLTKFVLKSKSLLPG